MTVLADVEVLGIVDILVGTVLYTVEHLSHDQPQFKYIQQSYPINIREVPSLRGSLEGYNAYHRTGKRRHPFDPRLL